MAFPKSRIRRLALAYGAHPAQAVVAALGYTLFRLLPLDRASAVGGFLGRTLGPRLQVSRRAFVNLGKAFPAMGRADKAAIVAGMWDNLGRVAAEFPHLGELKIYAGDGRIEVVGAENVDRLRDDGVSGIFFSGHLGNWEIVSLAATQRGLPLDRIYRAANNRLVEWLYRWGRAAVEGALIPKGAAGARHLIRAIRENRHLGMLVDQKMNDGIAAPFFGRAAMTSSAVAELALRFDLPVVPAHVERLTGASFRIVIEPPLVFATTGDRSADVGRATALVNATIEGWIRARPEQWLWLHNRWPD